VQGPTRAFGQDVAASFAGRPCPGQGRAAGPRRVHGRYAELVPAAQAVRRTARDRASGSKRFGHLIRRSLERRADWLENLRKFAATGGKDAYATFVDAARKHALLAVVELEGWAEGAALPFEDLMVLNLRSELEELIYSSRSRTDRSRPTGCSTSSLAPRTGSSTSTTRTATAPTPT